MNMNTDPRPDEAALQAFVDGRLDAEGCAEVERFLAEHPLEAARIGHFQAQNAALHRLYDPVLDEPHTLSWSAPVSVRRAPWPLAAALLLGMALGYAGHAALNAGRPSAATSIARQAALAHVAYLPEVRHPVEVVAAEEQHLVAWLSKRLDAPLKAPNLSTAGYRLLGGRLLPAAGSLGDAPVALLIYESVAGRRLSLMVRRAEDSRETAFQFAREGATSVFYWIDGPFGYALAGEVERDELNRVAQLVYRQLNP